MKRRGGRAYGDEIAEVGGHEADGKVEGVLADHLGRGGDVSFLPLVLVLGDGERDPEEEEEGTLFRFLKREQNPSRLVGFSRIVLAVRRNWGRDVNGEGPDSASPTDNSPYHPSVSALVRTRTCPRSQFAPVSDCSSKHRRQMARPVSIPFKIIPRASVVGPS